MALFIYNTLTRQKEAFASLTPDHVSMYVCGVTTYSDAHVGHAMSSIVFDVIRRYLERQGYQVRMVKNFTDVDDKVINRANELGVDPVALAGKYADSFLEELTLLNVKPSDVAPRVSHEIPEIIAIIQGLIDQGHAYAAGGDVYYRRASFPDYGKLSRRPLDEMQQGDTSSNKEDPSDFALWKGAKPGEPAWDSPWGAGRPGWHIECSAMSLRHLGPTVDIHGGGGDLIYPHHESEIAQSEAYTGREPFARFWFHAAMLRYQGEKMSKSLGNMVFARDLLKEYTADAIRLALLNHHYRESWEFHDDDMQWAAALAERLRLASHLGGGSARRSLSTVHTPPTDAHVAAFKAALDDDLDTPRAISILNAMATDILNTRGEADALRSLASVLGLRLDDPGPAPHVADGWQGILARFDA